MPPNEVHLVNYSFSNVITTSSFIKKRNFYLITQRVFRTEKSSPLLCIAWVT